MVSLGSALLLTRDWQRHATMGASGAVFGVTAFYATLFPKATILIMGVIPCPAWLAVGGFFLYDSYQTLSAKVR